MPLSILQVASGFPNWGGTELHILNLSEQLQRRGHEVTIACRPGRWVEERATAMGLATIPIEVMKQNDWHDFSRLRAYLREKRFQVMHVHWSTDVIVPGFAALFEHVPVRILSRHMPYPFKNRIGTLLYSRVLYNTLVPVSDSVRRTLLKSGVPDERIEVIHHGTDVEAFAHTTVSAREARQSLGLPEDSLAVGIIGRIAPEKGHQVLLEAVQKLQGRYPLHIVIIGNGPDEEAARRSAEMFSLSDRVHFAGFREDVNNAINALDIVAVPSTWQEPCSAVVQQGMALRKPVIGTLAGGTPEMIVDGVTGLLVPPSDAAALAEAIAALSGDAFMRKRMGEAGRARVEEKFSLRVMTDKIEDLYQRTYAQKSGEEALSKVTA